MSTTENLYQGKDALGSFLSAWRNRVALRYIKGNLVDLACGDNTLVHHYGRGTGIDIVDYGAVDLVVTDFCQLPVGSETADTVTIIASLNYFPQPEGVLKEVYRILKPDGQLVFTMSNPFVMKFWHMVREPHAHRSSVSPHEIQALLSQSGFKVTKREYFMLGINCTYVAVKK